MKQNNKQSNITITITMPAPVQVRLDDISKRSLLESKRGMAKEVERDIKLFRRLAEKG